MDTNNIGKQMYKIFNVKSGKTELEIAIEKPDINTVLWFSVDKSKVLIPWVTDKIRATATHRGALNTKFRAVQHQLFKSYYDLDDDAEIPYKYPPAAGTV